MRTSFATILLKEIEEMMRDWCLRLRHGSGVRFYSADRALQVTFAFWDHVNDPSIRLHSYKPRSLKSPTKTVRNRIEMEEVAARADMQCDDIAQK